MIESYKLGKLKFFDNVRYFRLTFHKYLLQMISIARRGYFLSEYMCKSGMAKQLCLISKYPGQIKLEFYSGVGGDT